MKKINSKNTTKPIRTRLLATLANVTSVTAQIGAGTASSWSIYQQKLPKELKR